MEHWPEVTIDNPQGYEALCARCGRREQVLLFGRTRGFAAQIAALVDGTSWPKGAKRHHSIGRCVSCGGSYQCSVFGYPDEVH